MTLLRAVSCWGNEASPVDALALSCDWGFEAVEGVMPADARAFGVAARGVGKEIFAEIATGCDAGSYVPRRDAGPADHLEDFHRKLDHALEAGPMLVTTLAGSDLWDFATSCKFLADLLEVAKSAGTTVFVETHRARPTFHPVQTARLLEELPDLMLTLDVSHWCVVCERLIPRDMEFMKGIGERSGHLHARVGYNQGPQVPDPRPARFGDEVAAHLECWKRIAGQSRDRGCEHLTITPEFGPDGYLQCHPLSGEPAADLREINRWMGGILRENLIQV